MQKPKKILITGPESTGKSTLCKYLAEKLNANWICEYAREYIEKLDRKYIYGDLKVIGERQFELQNKALKDSQNFLFCDTGLEVIKVWSEDKFGKCDTWIIENLSKQKFDIVFLLDIDIPWENDPMRENPSEEDRKYFLELYKKELQENYGSYHLINGSLEERVAMIDFFLS